MSSNLKRYVESINRLNEFFKRNGLPPKVVSLSNPGDLKYLLDRIEGDLSPENLTCDGELPRSQVQAKYRALMGAKSEIEKLLKEAA